MKYKTMYTYYSEKQLTLKNEQGQMITLEMGDELQFLPNFSLKKENDYQLIIEKDQSPNIYTVIVSAQVAKKLVEHSKLFKKKISTYHFESKEQTLYQTYDNIHNFLSVVLKEFKDKDLSANYDLVNNFLDKTKQHLSHLSEENNIEGDLSKKAQEYFKNTQYIIDTAKQCHLKNESSETYHTYLKNLEVCTLNQINSSFYWTDTNKTKDLDFHMVEVGVADAMDVLKIPFNLNRHYLAQAYQATELDTAVRETLPNDFWEDWVREQNLSMLKRYEAALIQSEKLEGDLSKKSTTSNKIKV